MNWGYIGLPIILAIAMYTVIPDFLLHHLGFGSCKRQNGPGVAITFDDGPNPAVTPLIIDVLARHQIPATFFIVGEKAARYPDLIKLILSKGHQIGLHSQNHRYAWFMSPWTTWRDWKKGLNTLERISQQTIQWVRPPWGTFNLVTWLWIKIHRKNIILWSAEGHDWQASRSPDQIIERILNRVHEGSIILLHDDGGEEGAPLNTLRTLEKLCCRIINEKKLSIIRLDLN